MLSYIGKKLFCRKTAKFNAKITRNEKMFVVSLFPVMVPLHPYHFNKSTISPYLYYGRWVLHY